MPPDSSQAPDRSDLPGDPAAAASGESDEEKDIFNELTAGCVIDGKYRVDRTIGRGAMGIVVQATHTHLGEKVALKFLRSKAKVAGEDFEQRFRREAKVSAMLKNEHITRVIDVGLWQNRVPYMVMDYLDGTDLREVMKTAGQLPIGTAIDYIVQVCVGIADAHAAGVVHRDLKPSNLFITKRPDGSEVVKILDFGISKWREGSEIEELTQTGIVLGSPKYMAPEQLFGSSEVDARADVWSIGAIFYEMLAGRPPFDLPTFTRICAELSTSNPPPPLGPRSPEVTPEIEAVVMKCFARDPAERTLDVSELAGDLLDAIGAPFSTNVRQKIAAILDPRNNPLSVSGSKGAMTSGAFGAMGSGAYAPVSITGSTPNPLLRPSKGAPASGGASGAPEAERPRRGALVWGILGGLAVAGFIGYLAASGGSRAAASAPTATAASVAPPAVEPRSAKIAPTPPATAAVTPSASASAAPPPPAAAAAPPPTTAAPPPPVAPAPFRRFIGRPVAPASPSPAPVAQAPAAPAATPAAPPASPPAPKADPLGDRQ